MAFDVAQTNRETPLFTVVSSYEVGRLGKFPSIKVAYEECVYLTDDSIVESVADSNGDGALDTLVLPGLGGVTDVVGRDVVTASGQLLGTITSAEKLLATPASIDELGDETAETYKTKVTLNAALSAAVNGTKVGVITKMPVGTTAYRRARGGKRWETQLSGQSALAMAYIKGMLGTAYFTAVRLALLELGISAGVSDAQLAAALTSLAAKGTNLDGILAQQAEKMEKDRLLNLVPNAQVYGEPPAPAAA